MAEKDPPPKVDLDDLAYREYLVWRGERLEDHYRKLQAKLKGINPDAAVMTWTVNACRYGHLFNGLNTTGGHGLPRVDVPLREEVVQVHGMAFGSASRGTPSNVSTSSRPASS